MKDVLAGLFIGAVAAYGFYMAVMGNLPLSAILISLVFLMTREGKKDE